ncbi:zinc ribbon domain-containing protein [Prevotella nigrescens]|uniref:double zinc ribbon domain-containing protein n=1 Tax=Prevotella nigrescens TaxID=28133 RepID=UPI0028EC3AEB|nr:zinc ribbon domain-containing protein [Prevotella nigrescens]
MKEIIGSMFMGLLLLVIYAIAVTVIGFFFSHVFNKKYPNLSAGWIMALPTLHIVNGVGLFWVVMYIVWNIGYTLAWAPSVENKIGDEIFGHFFISFLALLFVAITTVLLIYRGLNFTKTSYKKLKKSSIIATFIVVITTLICLIFDIYVSLEVFVVFLTSHGTIIALIVYVQLKYNEQLQQMYATTDGETYEHTVYNGVRNISKSLSSLIPNVSLSSKQDIKNCPYCGEKILAVAVKCKHCGEWLPKEQEVKKKLIPCPVCGEEIEEGTRICPYCNEEVNQ